MKKNKKQFTTAAQIIADPSFYEKEVGHICDNFFKDVKDDTERKKLFNVFCEHPKILKQLLQKDNYVRLFHGYFHIPKFYNKDFEKCIAESSPEKFVQLVRVNEAFLRNRQLADYKEFDLPKPWSDHVRVWELLEERYSNLDKIISDIIDKLLIQWDSFAFCLKVFSSVLSDRFILGIEPLARIYKEFLSRMLSNPDCEIGECFGLTSDLDDFYNEKVRTEFEELFDTIAEFTSFQMDILEFYCYDQTTLIRDIGHSLVIWQKPEDYYRSELNGVRYDATNLKYHIDALKDVGYCENDFHQAQLLNQHRRRNLFEDSGLLSFESRQILYTYDAIENIFVFGNYNITEALLVTNPNQANLFCLKKADLIKALQNCCPAIDKKKASSPAVYTIGRNKSKLRVKDINNYNVLETPFLEIDQICFCPTAFMRNPDLFFYAAQKALRAKSTKDSLYIEKILNRAFIRGSFNSEWLDSSDGNQYGGDVDVIVNDSASKTLLLIQVKAPFLRLSIKDRYFEKVNGSDKAIKQLVEVNNEELLMKYPETERVLRWYVSTSFEGTLESISGVVKVNLYELLRALRCNDFKDLQQLEEYVLRDSELFELSNAFKHFKSAGNTNGNPILPILYDGLNTAVSKFPLKIVEPNNYLEVSVGVDDEKLAAEFNLMLEKANQMKQNPERLIFEVLPFFKSYTVEYPKDYSGWSVLGNLYADCRWFNQAVECILKALELFPKDPFQLRKLYGCYQEMGSSLKDDQKWLGIQMEYWYIDWTS